MTGIIAGGAPQERNTFGGSLVNLVTHVIAAEEVGVRTSIF
ncbi:hypothetical protein ACAG24_021935 [Mycobacterium sp. pW049]